MAFISKDNLEDFGLHAEKFRGSSEVWTKKTCTAAEGNQDRIGKLEPNLR
jgi:hypothetical protein